VAGLAIPKRLPLENGANPNADGGTLCRTLQAATSEGHSEIARLLVEHGADANAVGGLYGTALQAAAWGGDTETVQPLLEQELTSTQWEGNIALHFRRRRGVAAWRWFGC
jgi:ankyrin repeat protein